MDIVKILTTPELQEIEQRICYLQKRMFVSMRDTESIIVELQYLLKCRKKIAERHLWDYLPELLPDIIEFNDALKGAFYEMWNTIDVMRNKINYEYQGIEATLWFDAKFPENHPLVINADADKKAKLQELWEALIDPDAHQAYKYGIHRSIHSNCFLEETFEEFVGMSESIPNWNEGLDPDTTKGLHLIMPFHELFEHTEFSIYDLIYIRGFQMEIDVEMEYPYHYEKKIKRPGYEIVLLFLQQIGNFKNRKMNDYNIFKVLKLERKETIHSAMIAAIVAHDEKCWKLFFDMLEEKGKAGFNIEALRASIIYEDNNHKWIDTEVHLTENVNGKTRDRGRADIWIGTNDSNKKATEKYRLIIENKIDADFQYRQLRKYYRYLTDENSRKFAGLFVLCVNEGSEFMDKVKEAAKEFNKESKIYDDENQKDTKYAIITYKDIISWLEEVIKETEEGDFKTAVKQYKEIIKGFYPETKK